MILRCPHCSSFLQPPLPRRSLCGACDQVVFYMRGPADSAKFILTGQQASRVEEAWRAFRTASA
jgi:hypothetical protein